MRFAYARTAQRRPESSSGDNLVLRVDQHLDHVTAQRRPESSSGDNDANMSSRQLRDFAQRRPESSSGDNRYFTESHAQRPFAGWNCPLSALLMGKSAPFVVRTRHHVSVIGHFKQLLAQRRKNHRRFARRHNNQGLPRVCEPSRPKRRVACSIPPGNR